MCIRDSGLAEDLVGAVQMPQQQALGALEVVLEDVLGERLVVLEHLSCCLLYTSDAADERSSVDLGGRRIIKKKKILIKVGCN